MKGIMEAKKQDLLQDVVISYFNHSETFYCKASLIIDGYVIEIKRKEFDTIDEAVTDIKNRISEAIIKFKPELIDEI